MGEADAADPELDPAEDCDAGAVVEEDPELGVVVADEEPDAEALVQSDSCTADVRALEHTFLQ